MRGCHFWLVFLLLRAVAVGQAPRTLGPMEPISLPGSFALRAEQPELPDGLAGQNGQRAFWIGNLTYRDGLRWKLLVGWPTSSLQVRQAVWLGQGGPSVFLVERQADSGAKDLLLLKVGPDGVPSADWSLPDFGNGWTKIADEDYGVAISVAGSPGSEFLTVATKKSGLGYVMSVNPATGAVNWRTLLKYFDHELEPYGLEGTRVFGRTQGSTPSYLTMASDGSFSTYNTFPSEHDFYSGFQGYFAGSVGNRFYGIAEDGQKVLAKRTVSGIEENVFYYPSSGRRGTSFVFMDSFGDLNSVGDAYSTHQDSLWTSLRPASSDSVLAEGRWIVSARRGRKLQATFGEAEAFINSHFVEDYSDEEESEPEVLYGSYVEGGVRKAFFRRTVPLRGKAVEGPTVIAAPQTIRYVVEFNGPSDIYSTTQVFSPDFIFANKGPFWFNPQDGWAFGDLEFAEPSEPKDGVIVFQGLEVPVRVEPRYLDSISFSSSSLVGGFQTSATVSLRKPAPQGGYEVALKSLTPEAEVPPSIRIPAGLTQMIFPVDTIPVHTDRTIKIQATAQQVTYEAQTTLRAPRPTLVTFAPNPVSGGGATVGKVEIDGPAPANGITFAVERLSILVSCPTSVTVQGGASTATFPVQASAVAADAYADVRVSKSGVGATGRVRIQPFRIASLTLSPASIISGSNAPMTGKITLKAPAPLGGLSIVVSTTNAAARPPKTVLIAEGKLQATFQIVHSALPSNQTATLSASYRGANLKTTASLRPVTISVLKVAPTSLKSRATGTLAAILATSMKVKSSAAVNWSPTHPNLPKTIPFAASGSLGKAVFIAPSVSKETVFTATCKIGGVTRTATLTVSP